MCNCVCVCVRQHFARDWRTLSAQRWRPTCFFIFPFFFIVDGVCVCVSVYMCWLKEKKKKEIFFSSKTRVCVWVCRSGRFSVAAAASGPSLSLRVKTSSIKEITIPPSFFFLLLLLSNNPPPFSFLYVLFHDAPKERSQERADLIWNFCCCFFWLSNMKFRDRKVKGPHGDDRHTVVYPPPR